MKIAVIGAGAMGSIYGGRLSLNNEVFLIDTNRSLIDRINAEGLILEENGEENVYHPEARSDSSGAGEMDLVILFVKSIYSWAALEANKAIIGKSTYLMTLQNGSGHEDILSEYADQKHIIIGTTEDNGNIRAEGRVRRGGSGNTNIGMLCNDEEGILEKIRQSFAPCGFNVKIHENILQLIWNKLFINVSLSALTGVLDCKMGYISSNIHASNMARELVREACSVAGAMGLKADEEEIFAKVMATSAASPEGITSICADLRAGRKTEVDTISGSVVKSGRKLGVPVPLHSFVVETIHAMECRNIIQ